MVFNTIFNNISVISWRSILLVEETGVPRENNGHNVSHWQILSHKCCIEYTLPWTGFKLAPFVWNRQVFSKYNVINKDFFYIGTLIKVWFIQDCVLIRVWFTAFVDKLAWKTFQESVFYLIEQILANFH
jgi:hypothetical protein